jgi:hypothetical protein
MNDTDMKDVYTRIFLKELGITPTKENIKKYRLLWWYNIRRKSHGLRLTHDGVNVIKKLNIETYPIDLRNFDALHTPNIYIWLDNAIDSPYYFECRREPIVNWSDYGIHCYTIYVMTSLAAVEMYLYDGDIKLYGYNKTMAKRNAQSLL